MQERLARLRSLPPEQRAELMKRYEAFRRLPEREQRELQERFARFQEMSPERRAQIRKAMGEILRAPPRERERYLENLRRWRELTPRGAEPGPRAVAGAARPVATRALAAPPPRGARPPRPSPAPPRGTSASTGRSTCALTDLPRRALDRRPLRPGPRASSSSTTTSPPPSTRRYGSTLAELVVNGRHLDGALRWRLAVDTGELRVRRFPALAHGLPRPAARPRGSTSRGSRRCNAMGPTAAARGDRGSGPSELTSNGRSLADEVQSTLLVREAYVAWSFGRAGFATLRAGRARYAVAEGLVHDDYGTGVDVALDLGAIGPPFELRAALFQPTRDFPRTRRRDHAHGAGAGRLAPLALRARRPLLRGAPRPDRRPGRAAAERLRRGRGGAALRAGPRHAGLHHLLARRWPALLSSAPTSTATLAWAGTTGSLVTFAGQRLLWTLALLRGRVDAAGDPPPAPAAVDVPLRGSAAWLRYQVSPWRWLSVTPWFLYLSGDRPPPEKARLGLDPGLRRLPRHQPVRHRHQPLLRRRPLRDLRGAPGHGAGRERPRRDRARARTWRSTWGATSTCWPGRPGCGPRTTGPWGGRTYGTELDLSADLGAGALDLLRRRGRRAPARRLLRRGAGRSTSRCWPSTCARHDRLARRPAAGRRAAHRATPRRRRGPRRASRATRSCCATSSCWSSSTCSSGSTCWCRRGPSRRSRRRAAPTRPGDAPGPPPRRHRPRRRPRAAPDRRRPTGRPPRPGAAERCRPAAASLRALTRGQHAAGGVLVLAARVAAHDRLAGEVARQLVAEALPLRLAGRPEAAGGVVDGDGVEPHREVAQQPAQRLGVLLAGVDAGHHHVLQRHPAARRGVLAHRVHQLVERPGPVDGHERPPLLRGGGVERDAEPELVPLGGVAPESAAPARRWRWRCAARRCGRRPGRRACRRRRAPRRSWRTARPGP